MRPVGVVERATRIPEPLLPEVRRLLWSYPHRDFQLRALGIDKEAMVEHLLVGMRQQTGRVVFEVCGGRLRGLVLAVADRGASRSLRRRMWSIRHVLKDEEAAGTTRRLMDVLAEDLHESADMVSARVAAADIPAVHAMQDNGFRTITGELAGVVPLQSEVEVRPLGLTVSEMRPDQTDEVARIAGVSHIHNRFAYDNHFEDREVRRLFEDVIRHYASDPDTRTRVAVDRRGVVAGFISYRLNRTIAETTGRRLASLDFIGVRRDVQTRGIGAFLNQSALVHLGRLEIDAVTVRTLMSNFESLGALRKLGLRITASNLVLHRWYE